MTAQREYAEENVADTYCTYLSTILPANLGAKYLLSSYEATVLCSSARISGGPGVVSTGI